MGAAALNHAIAWCLLALAISIASAGDMNTVGYNFCLYGRYDSGVAFYCKSYLRSNCCLCGSLG